MKKGYSLMPIVLLVGILPLALISCHSSSSGGGGEAPTPVPAGPTPVPAAPPPVPAAPTPVPTAPPPVHSISNIWADPSSPASVAFGTKVTIHFNYITNEPGGVQIFIRPFTGGSLTPNYTASGSVIYPTGDGIGDANFTITSGAVVVDQLRLRMYNADQSQLLFEHFISVTYTFS